MHVLRFSSNFSRNFAQLSFISSSVSSIFSSIFISISFTSSFISRPNHNAPLSELRCRTPPGPTVPQNASTTSSKCLKNKKRKHFFHIVQISSQKRLNNSSKQYQGTFLPPSVSWRSWAATFAYICNQSAVNFD